MFGLDLIRTSTRASHKSEKITQNKSDRSLKKFAKIIFTVKIDVDSNIFALRP